MCAGRAGLSRSNMLSFRLPPRLTRARVDDLPDVLPPCAASFRICSQAPSPSTPVSLTTKARPHDPRNSVRDKTNGASACGTIGRRIVGTECATWSDVYHCPSASHPLGNRRRLTKTEYPVRHTAATRSGGPSVSLTACSWRLWYRPWSGRQLGSVQQQSTLGAHHFELFLPA